jgi:hypothetical protein
MGIGADAREGDFAVIGRHIGIIGTSTIGNTTSQVLYPVPGLPDDFSPIRIMPEVNDPHGSLSPHAMLNITISFSVLASDRCVDLASVARHASTDHHTTTDHAVLRTFVLDDETFRVFTLTMEDLRIEEESTWFRIAFYRIFGTLYESSDFRFSGSAS